MPLRLSPRGQQAHAGPPVGHADTPGGRVILERRRGIQSGMALTGVLRAGSVSSAQDNVMVASSFTASTYALSTSVWKYHTHFEVFALNNLFVSALLFLTVKYLIDQDRCAEPAEHSVETCIAPPMPGHPRPTNSEIFSCAHGP